MLNSKEKKKSGFTLVELLIAMALGLVVIGALSSAFLSQRKTFDTQEQISEMNQGARAAVDMISREVGMAGYDPTGFGVVGVPSYSASHIQILADLNGDGDTSDPNEDITYTYDGDANQIDRNTQPFAENIQSFSLAYYDSDGGSPASSSDIREIEITVVAKTSKPDPNYQGGDYRTYSLRSRIAPPNLLLLGSTASTTTSTTTTPTTTTTASTTTASTTTASTTTASTTAASTTTASTTAASTTEATTTTASTSTPSTTEASTTTTLGGGGCTLSVLISASKAAGNSSVVISANVSDGTGPTTGATVTWTVTYVLGTTKTDSGTLSDSGGGVYSGATGKINTDNVTVEVEASKDTCTDGSASTSVP